MMLGGQKWFCGVCGRNCQNASATRNHFAAVHRQNDLGKLTSCSLCRITFVSEAAFESHCATEEHRQRGGEGLLAFLSKLTRQSGAAREERGRRRAAGDLAPDGERMDEPVLEVGVMEEDDERLNLELEDEAGEDDGEARIDGLTDEEALQKGMSQVGRYRVATPREIREHLAKFPDTGFALPNQRGEFNEAALKLGITKKVRGWFLEHCAKYAKCVAPGCGGPPCSHFPAAVEMPESMLLSVPVVFDQGGREVVSVSILPGSQIIRAWMADPAISQSVIVEPLERSSLHRGNASFCSGEYFRHLVTVVPDNTLALCIACYSDETTVVSVGTRNFHIASLILLNSSLSTLETIRPVMLLPKLKECLPDLSAGHLKRMRLLVFHACWEAVAQTCGVQSDSVPFLVNRAGVEDPELVYPVFSLFLGDTPEQNKVQVHRNGGLTEEICARCCATAENNDFDGFVLRLDRKGTVDKLLQQINDKRNVGEARDKLQKLSVHDVLPFTDRLRHFDASLCCPACSLHVGRLLWTKTLLELAGLIVKKASEAEGPAKRSRGERDPDDLIGGLNDQFSRFFPRLKGMYDRDGVLDIGVKTGNVLTEIAEMFPFILFNILPKELQFVQVAAVEWVECLRLWLKPGKSVAELGELERLLRRVRESFVELHERAEQGDPYSRPTFHSLLHPPMDQFLFGDDNIFATQDGEHSHSAFAKQPFRFETNKSYDYRSITKQLFSALYQRAFMAQLPGAVKPAKVARSVGLVSVKRTTIGAVIAAFAEWHGSVGVDVSRLTDEVARIARARGTWNPLSVPRVGVTRDNAKPSFFNDMEANSATGYRLGNGTIIRPFFGGNAVCKNCIVERAGSEFALVFLMCGLSNNVIDNVPLLFCKKLDHALREGAYCPLHKVPLLRDSDKRVRSNQCLVEPGEIVRVWTAVTVHTTPDEFQYVFAIPIDE